MTTFEKVYERLFMLRGVDTKHMIDCELVWRAAQADREAALAEAVVKALQNAAHDFSIGHAWAGRPHTDFAAELERRARKDAAHD